MTFRKIKPFLLALLLIECLTTAFAITCNYDEHECVFAGKCIDEEYVCDGDNDCEDWSDESAEACGAVVFPTVVTTQAPPCNYNEFECPEKCIPLNWFCDGEPDCEDTFDEDPKECAKTRLILPKTDSNPQTEIHWPFTKEPETSPTTPRRREYSRFDANEYDATNPDFFIGSSDLEIETFYISPAPKVPLFQSTVHPSTTSPVTTDTSVKPVLMFGACKVSGQCIALNANTYCNPDSLRCTCSPNYSFNGRECALSNLKDIFDNSDLQGDSSSAAAASNFFWSNWMEISLVALSLIVAIIIITFFYRRHRRKMHMTIPHPRRDPQPAVVSYLNTPASPECRLVLVGSSLSVQPALIQPTSSGEQYADMPPPYNTQVANPNLLPVEDAPKPR